jgi:HAD superfamily hydrolase (TIGR01484 family)
MLPIDALTTDEAKSLHGLLFDLDDTLLDRGRLMEAAYSALFRLNEVGLKLYAVTGRPSGWGELLVRQWPITGAVTENGAVCVHREGELVRRVDSVEGNERRDRRARIAMLVSDMRGRFPELAPADDVDARISDFTFDIGERRHLPVEVVDRAADFAREQGFRSVRSTVHLHVTLDGDDKASGSVRLIRALHGTDVTVARLRHAFIGDSENDQACFAAFPTSIAVKNLTGRPTVRPRFVTRGERAAGFVEAAGVLVSRRNPGVSGPPK